MDLGAKREYACQGSIESGFRSASPGVPGIDLDSLVGGPTTRKRMSVSVPLVPTYVRSSLAWGSRCLAEQPHPISQSTNGYAERVLTGRPPKLLRQAKTVAETRDLFALWVP
jgi:hypothetical protein